ncbi:transglutaminase domain-containing protein [Micromonospora zhanjiangensis]|uniref:Transglutaminase domain-containing protein n=1 Tax=Micromonospora zhanjiangensis TaxID=1522057 RepID=A0ABV8KRV9_9ACTN
MTDTRFPHTRPGRMTSPGAYAGLLDTMPADLPGAVRAGHGLLVHEHLTQVYGVTLTDADRETVHLRPVEQLLARIAERDDRPLDVPRPPERRVAANCRHFTVLLVTALRTRGVPARARCGFGNYFGTGWHEDHWVAERWVAGSSGSDAGSGGSDAGSGGSDAGSGRRDAGSGRWVLTDGQLDERQRELFGIEFDVLDVPRDRFVVAGDAWARYRAGTLDPDRCGLSGVPEGGWWWIAGNLMRDAAALCGTELLPWDCWGAMPEPADSLDDERAALFDELARLTLDPDTHADELRRLTADARLRLPPTVRNALRHRPEPL